MNGSNHPLPKGRGAGHNPANRFETTHHELELDQVEEDEEYLASLGRPRTEYLPDRSRTIIAENDSPDVGFEVEHQSVSWMRTRLYLLLCQADPRVPGLFGGPGFRDEDPGEGGCPRALEEGALIAASGSRGCWA